MNDDEYVERATTLDGHKAPPGDRLDGHESLRNFYNRLSVVNSLRWNGKWKDEKLETKKTASAIVDAICSSLDLTDYQKRETHRRFRNLPPKYNNSYETSLVALCVAAQVGHEDGRDYHVNQCHPNAEPMNEFAELFNDLQASYPALCKCWNTISTEVSS